MRCGDLAEIWRVRELSKTGEPSETRETGETGWP
jgi:hypothetical protein